MSKLPINQAQLIELWHQVRSAAEEQSKEFGDVALQYHLAEQFGLRDILDGAAGKRDQGVCAGLATLLMAIHRNCDPGSKLSFLEWYPRTILPELTGVSAQEIAYHDLLSSMDYWTNEAIAQVETDATLKLGKDYRLRLHTLAWDASSCYFDAQVNEIVQFGYSRDHRPDRPQIGTDMFIDPASGFVPYARSYEGNTPDATRFPAALEDFHKQYPDTEGVTILLDRGPSSENNLILLRRLRYSVVAGVALKGRPGRLIERVYPFEDRFNLKGTRFGFQVLPIRLEGYRFFLHIYYNHKKAKQEQRQRFRALKACQKELEGLRLGQYQLKTHQKIRQRVESILQKHKVKTFLKVQVKKPRGQEQFHLDIQPKKRALSKAEKKDGRFALITDRQELTSKDVLIKYRSKDKVESAFSTIKGPVALRPVFHYSPQRIKAHVFICHLALFLRNLLALLLKAKDIDLTPQKALKKVKEVHITKIRFQKTKQPFWILNQVDSEVQKIFDAMEFNPQQLLDAAGLSPP